MKIISVLTKQEKSFIEKCYNICYSYDKDVEETICIVSDMMDDLVFWLIKKDKAKDYKFSEYYNELLNKNYSALKIAYHKTIRKYIINKPWYIEDLDLAKRALDNIITDIITKKHLIDKYNFEQENELIKKLYTFYLKKKA